MVDSSHNRQVMDSNAPPDENNREPVFYDSIVGRLSDVEDTLEQTSGPGPDDIEALFQEDPRYTGLTDTQKTSLLLEEVNREYDEALLSKFRRNYGNAITALETAYKRYSALRSYGNAMRCLIELAWIKYNHDPGQEGLPKAKRLFAEATNLINTHYHEPGISEIRARLYHYQGLVHYQEKHYGEAVRHLMHARTFCAPDSLEAAKIMDSLAVHYEKTHDYYRAIQCGLDALAIKQRVGISHEETITLQILGKIYILKEEYAKATNCLEKALQLAEHLQDYRRACGLRNDLIRITMYQNQFDQAETLLDDVIAECEKHQFNGLLGFAHFYRCYLMYSRQQFGQCRLLLVNTVIPLFEGCSDRKGYAMANRLMATLQYQEGDHSGAIERMTESIAIFKEENQISELAKTYFELGKLYVNLNENELAENSMLEALRIAELNDLGFLTSYIEDEIYRLNTDKWQEIVDKRSKHERVFNNGPNIEDALESLSKSDEGAGINAPSQSLLSLLRVAQAMTAERDLEKLLYIIKNETEEALQADRCTVFVYDRDKNELWSKVATGLGTSQEIRFPAHLGIAGYVVKTGEVLNIQDAYADPRFNPEIDKKTGYQTRTILCMPMRNRKMEIIGIFQVLNKHSGHFDKKDENLLMAIATTAGVAIENASLTQEMKISFDSFVKTLSSTIDARDPITAGHSERVAEYSLLIGGEMKLPGEELESLKYASLLHDIGKIGIKEDILKKDGRLTEREYRHIQKHVEYTHEILKNVYFEHHLRMVPEIAASHHEKVDGSGYHRGLCGQDIHLSGRILAISDVFDAITSRRHYRSRMPFDRVLSVLRKDTHTHFDKDCIDSFMGVPLHRVARILSSDHIAIAESEINCEELIDSLDSLVTIAEYETMLKKPSMTRGEADIHRLFSAVYHLIQLGDLD
ncbi:MAG: HD domain-containing phosphohydrolase [Candidatus Melainabacteria bacterium]